MSTQITIKALHLSDQISVSNGKAYTSSGTSARDTAVFKECTDIKFIMNVEPRWTSQAAYGKMDEIPFYSNTIRTMSVAFKALGEGPTTSDADDVNLGDAIEKLQKYQYPVYREINGVKTIFAPPFFELTHKESDGTASFESLQGYINQLRITPASAEGHTTQAAKPGVNHLYEQYYSVNFTFVVMHKSLPGWNASNKWEGDRLYAFEGTGKHKNLNAGKKIASSGKYLQNQDPNTDVAAAVQNIKSSGVV